SRLAGLFSHPNAAGDCHLYRALAVRPRAPWTLFAAMAPGASCRKRPLGRPSQTVSRTGRAVHRPTDDHARSLLVPGGDLGRRVGVLLRLPVTVKNDPSSVDNERQVLRALCQGALDSRAALNTLRSYRWRESLHQVIFDLLITNPGANADLMQE